MTSVPNQGNGDFPYLHSVPEIGYANLADSGGFSLRTRGTITQTCKGDATTYIGPLHLIAIPVGSLHGSVSGLGGPILP